MTGVETGLGLDCETLQWVVKLQDLLRVQAVIQLESVEDTPAIFLAVSVAFSMVCLGETRLSEE
jgi:hypothetical protein